MFCLERNGTSFEHQLFGLFFLQYLNIFFLKIFSGRLHEQVMLVLIGTNLLTGSTSLYAYDNSRLVKRAI